MTDPTRMSEQPSLTTATGTIWVVVGVLFVAVVSPVLLILGGWLPLTVDVAVLAFMLVARFGLTGRFRLRMLAAGLIGIAALTLGWVLLFAASTGGGSGAS